MSEQREQPVVDSGKIDIDRFHIARSGGNGMQIFNDDVGKDAAFEPKFEFQVFLRRIMQSDAMSQA